MGGDWALLTDIIELFIKDYPEFEVEPAREFVPVGDQYLKVLPGEYNTDGVFGARLRKK